MDRPVPSPGGGGGGGRRDSTTGTYPANSGCLQDCGDGPSERHLASGRRGSDVLLLTALVGGNASGGCVGGVTLGPPAAPGGGVCRPEIARAPGARHSARHRGPGTSEGVAVGRLSSCSHCSRDTIDDILPKLWLRCDTTVLHWRKALESAWYVVATIVGPSHAGPCRGLTAEMRLRTEKWHKRGKGGATIAGYAPELPQKPTPLRPGYMAPRLRSYPLLLLVRSCVATLAHSVTWAHLGRVSTGKSAAVGGRRTLIFDLQLRAERRQWDFKAPNGKHRVDAGGNLCHAMQSLGRQESDNGCQ